jgi:hypothetical protein
MNTVGVKAISPGSFKEDRLRLILEVVFNGEIFEWEDWFPRSYPGSFEDYINERTEFILNSVEQKINEWDLLEPKIREIDNGFDEVITVPINRDEIVKPEYPDYYAKRANEYPPLADQIDALWKGGDDYQAMLDKISAIKNKYPKP